MLTLQSSKSWIVCLLMFKVNRDSQGDDILLTSQGVSFTEVLEGLKKKLPSNRWPKFCIWSNHLWGRPLHDPDSATSNLATQLWLHHPCYPRTTSTTTCAPTTSARTISATSATTDAALAPAVPLPDQPGALPTAQEAKPKSFFNLAAEFIWFQKVIFLK